MISAGLTTLGLTAFYLLPAFFEKNLTQVDTWILGDYFNFRLHFLYLRQFWTDNFGYGGSGWGPNDGLSFFLGWAQWLALLLSVVLMGGWAVKMCQRKKLRVIKNEVIFFGGMLILLGLTLFLSTMKAQMIWETFAGLLAFAQFPWRYVGIAIVILAVLAPYGLKLLPEKWQTGLTVALVTVLLVTSARYYRGERDLDEPAFYQGEAEFIAEEMSPTLVDYLPLTFANEWQAREPTTYVLGTEKQPEVLVDRMHEKLYRFREQKTATVELAIANYPGWTAEINGSEAAIQTSERGNIEVVVPSGEFDLGVKLRPTVLRFWSNLVSVVTVMGVISYGIGEQCRKKQ